MAIIKRLFITMLTIVAFCSSQVAAMENNSMEIINQESNTFMITLVGSMKPIDILKRIDKIAEGKTYDSAISDATTFIQGYQSYLKIHEQRTLGDVKNDEGSTLLHLACKKEMPHTVQVILKVVDQNQVIPLLQQMSSESDYQTQGTALHWATHYERIDCSAEILRSAGNHAYEIFTILTSHGLNSLHIAIRNDNLEMVKKFLEIAGPDYWKWIAAESADGKNALGWAIFKGFYSITFHILNYVGDRAYELICLEDSKGRNAFDHVTNPIIFVYLSNISIQHAGTALFSNVTCGSNYEAI